MISTRELRYVAPGTECYAVDSRLKIRRVRVMDMMLWIKQDDEPQTAVQHLLKALDGDDASRATFWGRSSVDQWVPLDELFETEEAAQAGVERRKEWFRKEWGPPSSEAKAEAKP